MLSTMPICTCCEYFKYFKIGVKRYFSISFVAENRVGLQNGVLHAIRNNSTASEGRLQGLTPHIEGYVHAGIQIM